MSRSLVVPVFVNVADRAQKVGQAIAVVAAAATICFAQRRGHRRIQLYEPPLVANNVAHCLPVRLGTCTVRVSVRVSASGVPYLPRSVGTTGGQW